MHQMAMGQRLYLNVATPVCHLYAGKTSFFSRFQLRADGSGGGNNESVENWRRTSFVLSQIRVGQTDKFRRFQHDEGCWIPRTERRCHSIARNDMQILRRNTHGH